MMLAAMVAMVMLLAAPAMAQTSGDNNIVQRGTATLNQQANGDQVASNDADQDARARQFQYQPGGVGGGGGGGAAATDVDIDIRDGGKIPFCVLFPQAPGCTVVTLGFAL